MKDTRFNYLKGTDWKTFPTRKSCIEWAKDPNHDGTYYVSKPQMTVKFTRKQLLEAYDAE